MIKRAIKILKSDGLVVLLFKAVSFLKRKIATLPRSLFWLLPNFLILLIANKISSYKSDNVKETIDYSFFVINGAIAPMQIKEEFEKLLEVFKNKQPKIILEIGTANGGSLFCLCKLAPNDALIISIDLPEGKFGGGYPEFKTPVYKLFKKDDQKLMLLREDSHLPETFKKIKDILNEQQIDFLFIDGDHEYGGVKNDFEMYLPLVKKGGVIAFHDITPLGLKELTGGVPIFWKEIKNNYQFEEFIKDQKQVGFGIGCLFIE